MQGKQTGEVIVAVMVVMMLAMWGASYMGMMGHGGAAESTTHAQALPKEESVAQQQVVNTQPRPGELSRP